MQWTIESDTGVNLPFLKGHPSSFLTIRGAMDRCLHWANPCFVCLMHTQEDVDYFKVFFRSLVHGHAPTNTAIHQQRQWRNDFQQANMGVKRWKKFDEERTQNNYKSCSIQEQERWVRCWSGTACTNPHCPDKQSNQADRVCVCVCVCVQSVDRETVSSGQSCTLAWILAYICCWSRTIAWRQVCLSLFVSGVTVTFSKLIFVLCFNFFYLSLSFNLSGNWTMSERHANGDR